MPIRGSEMEVLATAGEQLGCVLVLARLSAAELDAVSHVQMALSGGPARPKEKE